MDFLLNTFDQVSVEKLYLSYTPEALWQYIFASCKCNVFLLISKLFSSVCKWGENQTNRTVLSEYSACLIPSKLKAKGSEAGISKLISKQIWWDIHSF